MSLLSQNMNALFVQGSQSGQHTSLGSSSGASSSHSQDHAHIPATTAGTIVWQPQGSFNNAHQHGMESKMCGSNNFPPGHHDHSCGSGSQMCGSNTFPPGHYDHSCGSGSQMCGFVAHSYSGQQHGFRSQNYNGGYRSGNGGQSRNNSNNYRTGNNFRGRGFYGGNGPYSSGTRQGQNVTGSWSGNTEAKTNVVVECQICNKRGHTAVNCFHRNTGNTPAGFIVECQICGKRGHSALDCFHRANYTYQGQPPPASLSAMSAQQTSQDLSQDLWIVDSGASHHMTADLNVLNQVAPYQGSDNITIGNGSSLPIKHIGSTALNTADHSLVLSKVLHVPNIARNLLSVKQLCADNNSWFICDECEFFVQDKKTKEVVYHGRSKPEELFQIPVVKASRENKFVTSNPVAYLGKMVKSDIWHQRLGHPAHDTMAAMLKQSKVLHKLDATCTTCISCIRGKMSRIPFPVRNASCLAPFEKVHTDVSGPTPVRSVEGFRYYVLFVDEYTRFTWIFPMCNNSDVYAIFLKFYAFIYTQFGLTIKGLQTDGGGEYTCKRFTSFLAAKGIMQFISCPYTPQQNGMSERKHRHVVDIALTLLNASGLSSEFWYFACAHAVFLINKMPCKTLSFSSPYFLLYNKVLEVQSLRIFGTAVFPWIKPYNSHKLQYKSKICIFLGYSMGYKGVICYDPQSKKCIISRHVIFEESIFPARLRPSHSGLALAETVHQTSSVIIPFPIPMQSPMGQSEQDGTSMSNSSASTSSPASDTPTPPSLLPVLDPTQLQVLLPLSEHSSSNASPVLPVQNPLPSRIQTRLQTGAISRKNYAAYLATFPELNSLQILESCSDMSWSKSIPSACPGGFSFLADITEPDEPITFRVASCKSEWQHTMQEEYNALKAQGTWVLVPSPSHRTIVGSKWVYKIKKNPDGSISRYKARLVAQGYTQEHGLDYSETFSPVVRHTTVRLILVLAAQFGWNLRQLDIKNAFLHGDLEEEVYMQQPQGFVDPSCPSYVCKLIKSLYGLKQAPRAWNSKFTSYLPSLGFTTSLSDTSLFVKVDKGDIVLLLLYVDDIILTGSNPITVQVVISELAEVFDLKDMGRLSYFLGLQIQYKDDGSLFISQSKYAKDLLKKAAMETCKPTSTPSKPHAQFLEQEGAPLSDPSHYRSLVGALQYLTFTRPDLAQAVNMVCQFMTSPTDLHMHLVKRILRYLKGTLEYGLHYKKSLDFNLLAYSDSDWVADINTRRSITGFVIYLGDNPISWQSKKQSIVSRSSTEAEYKALAHSAADLFWIRSLLKDIHQCILVPPVIHCDNLSALALRSNLIFHSKIKHLDTDYHFVREKVQRGDLLVQYIPTEEQVADVFTKGLHGPVFAKHCRYLALAVSGSVLDPVSGG
ncbi:hypothetical protein ACFX12_032087 [Malus domestica]